MPPSDKEAAPIQPIEARSGEYNAQAFLVQSLMAKQQTATLVQVKAVRGGGLDAVGFVDVQPMVAQIDGAGRPTPHGIVRNLPFFRLQGGANAVVIDPQPGDIGLAIFASRDISAVKATRAPAQPGSKRRFDMADGLYLGGFLNGTPNQIIAFTADGIEITSPTAVKISAPVVTIDGNVAVTGSSITHNGVNIGSTHKHTQVQSGAEISGVPV
jgi:hypothetical protein